MRFMMLMIPKGYATAEPNAMPPKELVEEMMKSNTALVESGALISLDGLHPATSGARVTFAGGKPTLIEAPFPGVKEILGGYWMIKVNSKQEAIDWAMRCPAQDGDIIEVRQVQEMDDFPEDIQEVCREFEEKL